MRWKVNGARLVRERQEGSGGTRGHEGERTIEGSKVGQRRKSGVNSLSANKTWPWQQIGMYSCSADLVLVLTRARWQTVWWMFVIHCSRSKSAH